MTSSKVYESPLRPGMMLGSRMRVLERIGLPDRPSTTWSVQDTLSARKHVVKVLAVGEELPGKATVEEELARLKAVDSRVVPAHRGVLSLSVEGCRLLLLVRDYVAGVSLEDHVRQEGLLSQDQARALATPLLVALAAFQKSDPPLIHGDLNPRNLLLVEGEPSFRLVDFGGLKAAARVEQLFEGEEESGWPQAVDRAYAAPEVRLGAPRPVSDLYGVGGLLLFALTGASPADLRGRKVRDPVILLERHGVDRPFAEWVGRLLSLPCEARHPAVSEARETLENLEEEPEPEELPESRALHLDPEPGRVGRWRALLLVAGALGFAPLVAAALTLGLPAWNMEAEWVGALRIGVAIAMLTVVLFHGVVNLPALYDIPARRLRVDEDGIRYRGTGAPVENPWYTVRRLGTVGPLLRVTGRWRREGGKARENTAWFAPVYDLPLDQVADLLEEGWERARTQVTDVRRASRQGVRTFTWPVPLTWVAVGLLGLALAAFTRNLGRPEPSEPTPPTSRRSIPPLEEGGGLAALAQAVPAPAPSQEGQDTGYTREVPPELSRSVADFESAWVQVQPRPAAEDTRAASVGGAPTSPEAAVDLPEAPEDPQVAALPRTRCPEHMQSLDLAPHRPGGRVCVDAHGIQVAVEPPAPEAGSEAAGGAQGGRGTPVEGDPLPDTGSFRIDWTEVTVGAYRSCVDAGACTPPGEGPGCNGGASKGAGGEAADSPAGSPSLGLHPVNCVDRAQAEAWCRWAGRSLCTVAQWEAAARGPGGAPYPWGEETPTCDRVVAALWSSDRRERVRPVGGAPLGCGAGGTWPVGSRPEGVSPVGALDLSGNVAEWVAGEPAMALGGHFGSRDPKALSAEGRWRRSPDLRLVTVGFRCCTPVAGGARGAAGSTAEPVPDPPPAEDGSDPQEGSAQHLNPVE